jgi:hypothetical protein
MYVSLFARDRISVLYIRLTLIALLRFLNARYEPRSQKRRKEPHARGLFLSLKRQIISLFWFGSTAKFKGFATIDKLIIKHLKVFYYGSED